MPPLRLGFLSTAAIHSTRFGRSALAGGASPSQITIVWAISFIRLAPFAQLAQFVHLNRPG